MDCTSPVIYQLLKVRFRASASEAGAEHAFAPRQLMLHAERAASASIASGARWPCTSLV